MINKKSTLQPTRKNGFTLIELLVVISILGLLASIVIIRMNDLKKKARDTLRVAQLLQVRSAIEWYYFNHKQYPQNALDYIPGNWDDLLGVLVTEKDLSDDTIQDPLYLSSGDSTQSYGYMPAMLPEEKKFQNFRLRAKLEIENSPLLESGLTGEFLKCGEPTGEYACDPTPPYNFYCIGPSENFEGFYPGKPVIYLYPKQKTEVTVIVKPREIDKSVPEYKDGWQITAYPNGDLYNPADGKTYPYLFWEGKSDNPTIDKTKGFVIKKEQVEDFLNEKLKQLGLNQKETNDFIDYWAPRMKNEPNVYIYFMPQSDFDRLIPIEITPAPDTIIRIYMLFKSLREPISVQEQEIITPERKGFTVVEWGGDRSEIK